MQNKQTEVKTHSPTSGRLQAFGSDSSKSSNFLVWSIVKYLQTQVSLIKYATSGVLFLHGTKLTLSDSWWAGAVVVRCWLDSAAEQWEWWGQLLQPARPVPQMDKQTTSWDWTKWRQTAENRWYDPWPLVVDPVPDFVCRSATAVMTDTQKVQLWKIWSCHSNQELLHYSRE